MRFRQHREQKTLARMISLYCRAHHGGKEQLCTICRELKEYAMERIERCPVKAPKPVCSRCLIHCYKPIRREQIRQVMRFSGTRMLRHYPLDALLHLFYLWRSRQSHT